MDYDNFIKSKQVAQESFGFSDDCSGYGLFDFQKEIVEWALKRKSGYFCRYWTR